MDTHAVTPSHSLVMENQVTEVSMDVCEPFEEGTSLTTLQTVNTNLNTQDNPYLESGNIAIKRTKEEEQALTNRFLMGELSFSEYAAQYGEYAFGETAEEEIVDERSEEPGPSLNENDLEKSLAEIKVNSAKSKKCRGRIMKQKNSLPIALKGLMGEANLRYARGDHEAAAKMCFEVIRQFPWSSEPFETLASLYEEKGDNEKSLQISLVAAHLNPRSSKNLWINLAEKSEDKGDTKQAITCYGKAILANSKTDIDLHLKIAELYEKCGDEKSALKAYLRLLRSVEPHHGEKLVAIAKMLAERYHGHGELLKAKEALQVVLDKCPHLVTSELVNITLEILIGLKDYKTSLEILTKFCRVEVKLDCVDDRFTLSECIVPDDLVIDILAKTAIICVNLQAFHLLNYFLNKIKTLDPEVAGDVYFDFAEALMGESRFKEATELLTPLTQSSNFNLPAIWLKIAECYRALNLIHDSIKAYMIVVERAPQLLVARLAVSDLLIKQGRRNEALEILTQDADSETFNSALLYERVLLLQNVPEQKEQFMAVAQLYLGRHFAHITSKEDLHALTTLKTDRKKIVMKESKSIHKSFTQGDVPGEFSQAFNEPPVDEEWQLFKALCEICLDQKMFDTLQRITFSAQGSQRFAKYSSEIDLLCLSACYFNYDAYFGYNMVRSLVLKNLNCERSWNVFNTMILRADDSRHNRFLMRLLIRNPHHIALTILHANNCLVAGTYKYALSDYTAVYQKENLAMMAFLIGVTLCQMACQKFSAKKHSLVTQSAGYFWKYKDLRGVEGLQESHYNIGRALHQLGLLPPAIHHYKKSLEVKNKLIDDNPKYLNLQREAAFNLHLIYLNSGAKDIARMYIEKYIVI